MKRPLIAVTMGDPAGIGPEIIVKAFACPDFTEANRALVIGDREALERAARVCDVDITVHPLEDPEEAVSRPGFLGVIPASAGLDGLAVGQVDGRAGKAAYDYLARATELASAGRVAAIATAPINKAALSLAGITQPGHTEILAALTGTKDYAMMLVTDDLKVIHVSTHVPMREAVNKVKRDRELTTIRLAYDALRRMGIRRPRIAVSGLNPHAGEDRLFGDEDADEILPAILDATKEGIDASGPWPGDTVFMRAKRGEFDIVVAQYHDQGHIPIKLLGLESGVNVTVGLPFFRTSVDHGTAFDIAGTGRADHQSMRAAIDLATALSTSVAERA